MTVISQVPRILIKKRLRHLKKECKKIKRQEEINDKEYKVWEHYTEKYIKEKEKLLASLKESTGDQVLKDLRYALSCFKTRSKSQTLFHEVFTYANFKNIYGDDYKANELRIKLEHDIDKLYEFVLLCVPRRHGKSVATAMFVAAFMYACRTTDAAGICTITLFSPARRQSQDLMKLVKAQIKVLKSAGLDFEEGGEDNQERFSIYRDGIKKTCVALPARQATTRGAGGQLAVAEEMAVMPKLFFLEVIAPILRVGSTAFIAISTIRDKDNYFTTLSNLLNKDGTPFFNVFKFFMTCEECRNEGKEDTCKHMAHLLPAWISEAKDASIKYLYEQLNEEKLMHQEINGIASSVSQPAFHEKSLIKLFSSRHYPSVTKDFFGSFEIKDVFISIDPTGGGEGSDLALCSCIYHNQHTIILGLENIPATFEEDYMPYVIQHLHSIRRLEGFDNVRFVITIENNLGIATGRLFKAIYANIKNFLVITKDGYDLPNVVIARKSGVQQTPKTKEMMYYALKDIINYEQLRFYKPNVTTYVPKGRRGYDHKALFGLLKKMLQRQLTDFCVINKQPNDPVFQEIKRSYSGKEGGKKDDLCMALQLNNFWARQFLMKTG